MKLVFKPGTPLIEQLTRLYAAKEPGRKHQKRKGVRAKERERASQQRSKDRTAKKAAKYKAQVSAYWRGELDTFPSKD